ncbi:DUF3489 domain-containing protein [Kaistia algarum]|uniref:DUF3489 domain-containing protein n=1 Tax=Kaistia algarum TaxID=2083279 RepID=UPI00225AE395|nr:DUF3489 domain-containing protein [Kaistia algarum]MCX5515731.1 DUF3489 domain-containing protein [Kaistia algarum]
MGAPRKQEGACHRPARQGEGASVDDITGMTGWLAHTIRALLTSVRRAGMAVETIRRSGEPTRYRLMEGQGAETTAIPPVDTVELGQAEEE